MTNRYTFRATTTALALLAVAAPLMTTAVWKLAADVQTRIETTQQHLSAAAVQDASRAIAGAQELPRRIEHKVGTGEHSDQLGRCRSYLGGQYSEFRRILGYLTPDGEEPSDDAWTAISYREVLSMVETVVANRGASLGDAVTMALEHYARMLRRNIVTDNELAQIAKRIYRKHKEALDFIDLRAAARRAA